MPRKLSAQEAALLQPGDKVVCINDQFGGEKLVREGATINKGQVYEITRIDPTARFPSFRFKAPAPDMFLDYRRFDLWTAEDQEAQDSLVRTQAYYDENGLCGEF